MSSLVRKFNTFTFFRLPAAWWCGVRLRHLDQTKAVVSVRHHWFNQNPFQSMFWAVQGMAAEFSTGTMVIHQIRQSGHPISMLVAANKAVFTKKATGRITFTCEDGHLISDALKKTIDTGEGQTLWMKSTGINEGGIAVSEFHFQWTLKLKR